MVLKILVFNGFYLWGVVIIKELIFNIFLLWEGVVVLTELILTVFTLGGRGGLQSIKF